MPNLHLPCTVAPSETDFYRLVAERTPAMLAVFGADGHYVFANDAYAQAFGRDAASLLGQSFSEMYGDVFDAATYARIAPQIQKALAGATASCTGQLASNLREAASLRQQIGMKLDLQMQPVFDSAREVTYVLVCASRVALNGAHIKAA